MSEKLKLTSAEKKKYLLPTKADFEILDKCKQLEKSGLTKYDRFLANFIKTQLEKDWRKTLLKELNRLLRKYKR
ncbi:hypothetical protein J4470_00405 [Candidatus Woesearchaeota archaeon]|nr:hypothetical protein [Candidatus Woesearchaeota archaeon]